MTAAVQTAQLGNTNPAWRNRIINGAMMIDQRNAGASVSINTAANTYAIDRWRGYGTNSAGVFTMQRSSSAPPSGFTNFLRVTVTTADSSLSATDFYAFSQPIEGLNIADLGWGSANAQTVTLSFLVRSSLTGTFTGSINANPASGASYVFTYTINSANTWEYKTITISGPTSGTFPTDNTTGFSVWYSLALGSDSTTSTVGSWQAAGKWGSSSAVNAMATLNATFDVTGVQLEKGSTATSFDYRPYGTELALCQRYYFKTFAQGTAPAQNAGLVGSIPSWIGGGSFNAVVNFPAVMRATPTIVAFNPSAANSNFNSGDASVVSSSSISDRQAYVYSSTVTGAFAYVHATASIEL